MIILKTRSEDKVTETRKWFVTLRHSKIHLHTKIWNSYLKEYMRHAPDTMQFLEFRSQVKFKDTVTQLWYRTLRHPTMHLHIKFEIFTSNNIRDMLRTQ